MISRSGFLFCVVVLASLVSSCANYPYYVLTVRSSGVKVSAIDTLEIVIEPGALNERFAPGGPWSYDNITATLSSDQRQLTVRIPNAYIRAYSTPMGASGWALDVPLIPLEPGRNTPSGMRPVAIISAIQGSERIARVSKQLEWPLVSGGSTQTDLLCSIAPTNYSAQCAR